MMDDAELIERLRGWAKDIQEGSEAIWAMDQDLKEAADRVEALIAERDAAIARLTEENKRLTHDLCSDRLLVIEQGKKLDEAIARADAAEAALSATRDAALEEAAKAAESPDLPVFKRGWSTSQDAAAISTMMSVAAAIRAKKGKSHE